MKVKDIVRAAGGTTIDMPQVPIALLAANPENMRLDTDGLRTHIRSIADSILATGYLRSRPLTVRFVGETAIIVDGNCRFAAVQIAIAEGAEIVTLPCVLEPPNTTPAERLANQYVANSGLSHSPIEYVEGIKLLLSYGWTDQKIADRFGKSRQWVSNIMDLGGASPEVHQMIAGGTISATQAIKLIRSEGENAGAVIAAVAEQAKTEGKSRVTAKAFRKTDTPNPEENKSVRPIPQISKGELLAALKRIAKLSPCWSDASAHEMHVAALEAIDWEVHALIATVTGEPR